MQREYKEYIEREGAKELLRIWITDCVLDGDNDGADCYRDCIDLLDSIPAADVAPVVRCKDCAYWTKIKDSAQGRCALFCHYPTGSWYCANGEKEEDE